LKSPAHFRLWSRPPARIVFFDVREAQFCDGENLDYERPLFLLAVGFYVDVVLSALTIAKLIRDVCSFPLPLTFGRFHD
jgi:hypothetical protein